MEDPEKLWTKGWIPDSDPLRWSLAAAIRVEGVREGWGQCHSAAENTLINWTYIGESDDGEYVECTAEGETLTGELVQAHPATVAILLISDE